MRQHVVSQEGTRLNFFNIFADFSVLEQPNTIHQITFIPQAKKPSLEPELERTQRGGAPGSPFGSNRRVGGGEGGGGQQGGSDNRKQEAAIPSDAELLDAMDPQEMWKDVQKHAAAGELSNPVSSAQLIAFQ